MANSDDGQSKQIQQSEDKGDRAVGVHLSRRAPLGWFLAAQEWRVLAVLKGPGDFVKLREPLFHLAIHPFPDWAHLFVPKMRPNSSSVLLAWLANPFREVTSPVAGDIVSIRVAEDATVREGALIATMRVWNKV
jgi:hypothetical protein